MNGDAGGDWRSGQLIGLPSTLRSLTLLLPDRDVVHYALPRWLRQHSFPELLSSLSIVCLNSPIVNPLALSEMRPGLGALTSLTLHGCTKLSDSDVIATIQSCGHLTHLALEAVSISVHFYRLAAPYLPHLKSLRTSHPGRKNSQAGIYYDSLSFLVGTCPHFESFTHYLSGDTERGLHPTVSPEFVQHLVHHRGDRLVRFEVSGLSMTFDNVRDLCYGTPRISQLVIPVASQDLVRAGIKELRLPDP